MMNRFPRYLSCRRMSYVNKAYDIRGHIYTIDLSLGWSGGVGMRGNMDSRGLHLQESNVGTSRRTRLESHIAFNAIISQHTREHH